MALVARPPQYDVRIDPVYIRVGPVVDNHGGPDEGTKIEAHDVTVFSAVWRPVRVARDNPSLPS